MSEILTRKILLAAALLLAALGGRAPARADDQAASSGTATAFDPMDLNQDGVVTPKERRQYRRAHRSHNGASVDEDQQAAANAAQTDSAAQHSADAAGRASSAANALKNSLPSADAGAMPGGAGGAGAAGKSAAGGAGTKPSGNPSDPRSPSDFVLAARSGYAPAFAAAGLKLAPDGRTIVRADGSPATAEDYARLRRGILEMPAALGRRPDFFAAVSPAHFSDLKRGYRENPDLADSVYKHVGTTDADRDFVHTASCSKMSGDCNENVEKSSYKKGDFVAPEDLDRMWGALQKELDDAGDPDGAGPKPSGALKPGAAAGVAEETGTADENSPSTSAEGGKSSHAGTEAASGSPAAIAARAARRFWRATASAFGFGDAAADDAPSHALELGALGTAAIAALVYALRRKV